MSKVLVACEESQALTIQFRAKGIEAYSCDIEPPSGGHPEWHIQDDVRRVLRQNWTMVVAFPPCTHLASSGAKWFKEKRADGRQQQGMDFFMQFVDCAPLWAIENPVGIMSTEYRKPDQIIQPWQFGDPFEKRTCLWLGGLPPLTPTKVVEPPPRYQYGSGRTMPAWYADCWGKKDRAKIRSKTFPGVARAMADQWSLSLENL